MPVLECPGTFVPKVMDEFTRSLDAGDCGPCSLLTAANMASCGTFWNAYLNTDSKREDLIADVRYKSGVKREAKPISYSGKTSWYWGSSTVKENIDAYNGTVVGRDPLWMTNLFAGIGLKKPVMQNLHESNGPHDFDSVLLPALQNGKQAMVAVNYAPIDWFPATSEGDGGIRHKISGQWCFRSGHMVCIRRYRLATGSESPYISAGTPIFTMLDPLADGRSSTYTGADCNIGTGSIIFKGGGIVSSNGPTVVPVSVIRRACEMYQGASGKFCGGIFQAAAPLDTLQKPVANFNFLQNTGNLGVVFTDTSTNTPDAWDWNFGDATAIVHTKNPSHLYASAGTYSVAETASNAAGSSVSTKSVVVTAVAPVGNPPVVNFTWAQSATSLAVNFTDASSNAPTSWAWTFGDAGTSTLKAVTHTYASVNTYTVTLTATNAYGTRSTTKTITLVAPVLVPVANFASVQNAGNLGVVFTDTSTNTPTSWSWDFGDSSTIIHTKNPTHVYASAGTYSVTLTVANSAGSDPVTKSVVVRTVTPAGNPPVAAFSFDQAITSLAVSFTDGSSNAPTSWLWNFGDSTTSTSQNPSHTYATVGNKTVSLTATNASGSDVITQTVTVIAAVQVPVANFTWTQNTGNLGVVFGDTTTNNPDTWSWDFGDSSSLVTVKNPSHIYASAGTYSVTLTVTNEAGSNFTTKSVAVVATPGGLQPLADFTSSQTVNTLQMVFTDASSNAPASWAWTFGDGGTSSLENPSHTYASAGTYTVTLISTNASGSDTVSKSVLVNPAVVTPVTNFSADQVVSSLQINFFDLALNAPTTWAWDFGDTGTSSTRNPSHTYAVAGDYSVSLTASNTAGSNLKTKVLTVNVIDPNAPPDTGVDPIPLNPCADLGTGGIF